VITLTSEQVSYSKSYIKWSERKYKFTETNAVYKHIST